MKQTQQSLPKGYSLLTLILGFGFVVLVGGVATLMVMQQQALARDAIRVADMARLEAAFATLSFETSGYADAALGCGQAGNLAQTCALGKYLPMITSLKDPGKNHYVVTKVPDDSTFAVTFTLERGFGSYAKGAHTLSPEGIR